MKSFTTTIAALAAAAGLTTTAAAQTPVGVNAPQTRVAVRTTPLGKVLVDGRGRTLYLFERDRNGVSACPAPAG